MYKCVIVDDEPIARRIIRNHLSAFEGFIVEAECANALEAMQVLSKKRIDLLFCDIQMPQITGVDFIRSLVHPPIVIFTTAYRDYAVDAFELNVMDYLLKPISFERFAKTINKFLENNSSAVEPSEPNIEDPAKKQNFIFLKADKKHHKLILDEIVFIESFGDYILVYTEVGKITTKERISAVADLLPEDKFIRVHRSFIVSINKIKSIGAGFVEVGKKKIPIGRMYKKEVIQLLG